VRFAVVALIVLGLAASGRAATQAGCPGDPAFGTVHYPRAGKEHVLSLATCTDTVVGKARERRPPASFVSPNGLKAAVETSDPTGRAGTQAITVDGRAVYRVTEKNGSPGPIILVGWSPDSQWILFSIDPMFSASIMADGLQLKALNVASGRVVPVAFMLLDYDYLTWCGSTLVLTAGGDRIATDNKQLVVARAPGWKPHALWAGKKRSFGSVACAPDGRSVAVLSQPESTDASFFHTKWQLWRVGLNGARSLLDTPPAGSADESPRWSRDGSSLLFVRERKGYGQLMLLRDTTVSGPLANLGYSLGYYGHHDWWLGMTWSAGA
jgi:Tol biopolymer transport system component